MSLQHPRRTRASRPVTFRPGCEALEQRTVPAATFNSSNGAITIAGTNHADTVAIQDQGNQGDAPRVQVFFNGQLQVNEDGKNVKTIKFDMGGNNDSVQYDLGGTLATGEKGSTRKIGGALGQGKDTFTANVKKFLASGQLQFGVSGDQGNDTMTLNMLSDIFGTGSLDCTFKGGDGRDTLAANATTGDPLGGPGVEIGIGSKMSVKLLGGLDRDQLAMDYAGDLDGALSYRGDGASDRDNLTGSFDLAAGSGFLINPGDAIDPAGILLTTPATLNAKIIGGSDSDRLTLVVKRGSTGGNLTIDPKINGGPQRDTCSTAGSNVTVPTESCP
jgi:hypothetical protein